MKIALAFLALVTIAMLCSALIPSQPTRSVVGKQVTLKPAQGNTAVQMFDTLSVDARVIAKLPAGTVCERLSDAITVDEPGVPMRFYHLDCSRAVGYVNVLWVR